MSKFTFIREETNYYNNTKSTAEFSAVDLENVIDEFEKFLKGAGFVFDGHLRLVDEPKWEPISEDINIHLNDYRIYEQEEIDIRS